MCVVASFEVEGADDLRKKLSNLGDAASGRVIRSAANFAMTPVLKEARRNAPKGTRPHKTYKGRVVAPGFLRRNIVKKTKLSRDKSRAFASVSARGEAWYGRLIETGYTAKGGREMPARPWLRPAMLNNKGLVFDRYKSKLRERIKKEARR